MREKKGKEKLNGVFTLWNKKKDHFKRNGLLRRFYAFLLLNSLPHHTKLACWWWRAGDGYVRLPGSDKGMESYQKPDGWTFTHLETLKPRAFFLRTIGRQPSSFLPGRYPPWEKGHHGPPVGRPYYLFRVEQTTRIPVEPPPFFLPIS